MQKTNLCQLTNKVLVYEETDTISQSIFNSKKRLFDQTNKEVVQTKPRHIQNITKMPLPKIINKNNNKMIIQNQNINNINNNNKNVNKIKKIDKKSWIKKVYNYRKMKYNKIFEINSDIFMISCIINKQIKNYNDIDHEYMKEYYSHKESKRIIPKKEIYYRHHMQFLEKPYFNNANINKIRKSFCLEKLNIYLCQKKKGRKNKEIENPENEHKIFDTSVLELIENYSTTMIQGPNNEKYPPLIPFEIFKRCEDTNKNQKEQKSIITFSESEISCASKNIMDVYDKSLIGVVKDLSEKQNNQKLYKEPGIFINNAHNSNNSKSLTNKKRVKNAKESKQTINAIYTIKQNAYELNKMEKKINNYFPKKKDNEKFIKFNNRNNINNINNNKNEEKELIKKKRVSTSTNKKNKQILFDTLYQKTISKSNSKKENHINIITSNKNEENLLKSDSHQNKLVAAIVKSINSYDFDV